MLWSRENLIYFSCCVKINFWQKLILQFCTALRISLKVIYSKIPPAHADSMFGRTVMSSSSVRKKCPAGAQLVAGLDKFYPRVSATKYGVVLWVVKWAARPVRAERNILSDISPNSIFWARSPREMMSSELYFNVCKGMVMLTYHDTLCCARRQLALGITFNSACHSNLNIESKVSCSLNSL